MEGRKEAVTGWRGSFPTNYSSITRSLTHRTTRRRSPPTSSCGCAIRLFFCGHLEGGQCAKSELDHRSCPLSHVGLTCSHVQPTQTSTPIMAGRLQVGQGLAALGLRARNDGPLLPPPGRGAAAPLRLPTVHGGRHRGQVRWFLRWWIDVEGRIALVMLSRVVMRIVWLVGQMRACD